MFTFKTDFSKFNRAMEDYAAITKRGIPEVFKMQMRLLMKQVMSFTFPKQRAQGENAVRRDIARAITPTDAQWVSHIRNDGLRNRIQKLLDAGSRTALDEVLTRSKMGQIVPFSPMLHKSARNARGRVTKSSGKLTTDVAAHKAYTDKKVKLVGWARSGWTPMLNAVGGGTIPSWVRRHGTAGGSAYGNPDHPTRPTITGINTAVKIPGYQASVDAAMRVRERAMQADIMRILAGGATKAGFKK